jgi:uncharacterized membrane protein (DUF4010 family)
MKFGVALGIGLIIGIERGWEARGAEEGQRIAGIRTFALVALLGAIWALLAEHVGQLLLGFGFLAMVVIAVSAYYRRREIRPDVGTTTVFALLITFSLGALAVMGYEALAAATAVIVTLLLSLKLTLHTWLKSLEKEEVVAGIKLLVISVVLLPVLPNKGYGPWESLNPYAIWWLVVLIAAISFVGYFAMKLAGTRKGIVFTGLFGGLVSSTALTLNFSRLANKVKLRAMLEAGVLIAAATMFPRILVEVAVVNHSLLIPLSVPIIVMALVLMIGAFVSLRGARQGSEVEPVPLDNPLELVTAVRFGALLALVMVLAKAFEHWFGDAGIYAVAVISGLADVDAITLSLAHMANGQLPQQVAGQGIVLAAIANTVVKGTLAWLVGGTAFAKRLAAVMILASIAGGVSVLLFMPTVSG